MTHRVQKGRRRKAEKNKDIGDPIELKGVPIDVQIRGDYAWIAENTHLAKKIDLKVSGDGYDYAIALSMRAIR